MAGFNFGVIGKYAAQFFDTDEIDIGRAGLITLPDGSETVADEKTPRYIGVKCHIAYSQTDNPDPETVGSMPVIVNTTINCAVDVDLQNGDYIQARKLDVDGNVLGAYEGTIGAPTVNQGRQEAVMAVRRGA